MTRRLLATAAALALGMAAWVQAPAVHAAPGAEVTETGWWSRNPFASPPARGFQVANAPDGAASVSAVRIAVEGRISKATLVINEAGGVPEAATIRACSGASSWSASDHAWAAAPASDCSKAVSMTRNAAGANFAADITPLLQGAIGSATIMIVPGGAPLAWQVDFSIAIVSAEAEPATTTTTTASPGGSSGGQSSAPPSGSGSFGASGSGASSSFAAPTPASNAFDFGATTPSLPSEPTVGSDATLDPASPADDFGSDLAATVSAPSTGASQPWGRLVVFLPLSILAGAAIAFGRRFALDRLAG